MLVFTIRYHHGTNSVGFPKDLKQSVKKGLKQGENHSYINAKLLKK